MSLVWGGEVVGMGRGDDIYSGPILPPVLFGSNCIV